MSIEASSPDSITCSKRTSLSSSSSEDLNATDSSDRSQWGNEVQFILSALGLAVGLGNIWRFPYVAYDNGGAAFLIPYLCCGLLFGLPMVYAEFMIGQYSRSGPGLALGRYAAGLRGVGWSMSLISITVSIYYCLIISWAGVYLGWVVSGQSWRWTECDNWWNTKACVSQDNMNHCLRSNASMPYYFNGTCHSYYDNSTRGAAEEFFLNYLTTRSSSIEDFGGINWPIFGSLLVFWALTTLILIKGITIMGYLSYFIVPFPYVVIVILFFRGITLDGAMDGINYYLLKPNFEKLLSATTWSNALKQLMFSMSIGYGGLISLSSYSKPRNNFFRDALIVICGDTIMSLIGGVAAFTILGYLAKLTGKTIPEVVSSGTSLAFIAYPEAISTMSCPWLWNGLFFSMLLMLGISSEIAYVEAFTGMITDCFPATKKLKWLVTMLTCASCLSVGIVMTTNAGFYWFSLFDEFTGSTCACLVAVAEVVILTFYGFARWFGSRSPIFAIFWGSLCPLLAITIAVVMSMREVPFRIDLDKQGHSYTYPAWAEVIGWLLNLGVCLPIPIFFFYKWIAFRREGIPFHYLFRPTIELPSCKRYYETRGLPQPGEEASTNSTTDA